MHRLSYRPHLAILLFCYSLLTVSTIPFIVIGGFIDNANIVFKADYHVLQCRPSILRETLPWLADNSILITKLLSQVFSLLRTIGRLVIKIIDNIARSTCYHQCIHGMMPVINTFLVEATLQFQRNRSLKDSFTLLILPTTESIRLCQLVESFKARINNTIPNIIQSPVFLQSVSNAACTRNNKL